MFWFNFSLEQHIPEPPIVESALVLRLFFDLSDSDLMLLFPISGFLPDSFGIATWSNVLDSTFEGGVGALGTIFLLFGMFPVCFPCTNGH
jgi:hypothetical protein